MSCNDLFASHSLLSAPFEAEKECRELRFEGREGEGMRHSPDSAPSKAEKKRRELRFERREGEGTRHSPDFAPFEAEKKCRELRFERREGEGMRHSLDFASSDLLVAYHSPEITRLDELVEPFEARGMPLEREIASCTSQLARLELEGMPHDLRGMERDGGFAGHSPRGKSREALGLPSLVPRRR